MCQQLGDLFSNISLSQWSVLYPKSVQCVVLPPCGTHPHSDEVLWFHGTASHSVTHCENNSDVRMQLSDFSSLFKTISSLKLLNTLRVSTTLFTNENSYWKGMSPAEFCTGSAAEVINPLRTSTSDIDEVSAQNSTELNQFDLIFILGLFWFFFFWFWCILGTAIM